MKSVNKIVVMLVFLSLYLSAINPLSILNNQTTQTSQNNFQKKQNQISIIANEFLYESIEIVGDNIQNTDQAGLKKYSGDRLVSLHTIVSKENSKFKQYSAIWHNQLIASRKTDQLYPQHTFG